MQKASKIHEQVHHLMGGFQLSLCSMPAEGKPTLWNSEPAQLTIAYPPDQGNACKTCASGEALTRNPLHLESSTLPLSHHSPHYKIQGRLFL